MQHQPGLGVEPKHYRLVMLRKTIAVMRGQKLLMPEIRYFFDMPFSSLTISGVSP